MTILDQPRAYQSFDPDNAQPPSEIGVMPSQWIRRALEQGIVGTEQPVQPAQIQPNSLDLRLGSTCYRVRCSFLPGEKGIDQALKSLTWYEMPISDEGTVLEREAVYFFPLQESLNLPDTVLARGNPKSSTGRLDIFTRLVTEKGSTFDDVPAGYRGRLFLEVVPRSFAIKVRPGDCLAQIRFQVGKTQISDDETREIIDAQDIILTPQFKPLRSKDLVISDGIFLTVNLSNLEEATIGFKAKKNTAPIDLRAVGHARTRHYWDRLYSGLGTSFNTVVLEPDEFYIFASRELISLPPGICAEMVPFDAGSGELRTHYAGFFDSGFGYSSDPAGQAGAAVVLEIRSRDVPFRIEENQPLFKFVLMRNAAIPDMLYGTIGSNYQNQRLRLSKQFRMKERDEEAEDDGQGTLAF